MIKRYCPELANFDKKHIYEPWKAPISDQKKWGCRVTGDGIPSAQSNDAGTTYPKPMFNFDERRQICLDGMKHAYDVGLRGNDAKVKNGSWKSEFENSAKQRPSKKQKIA